MTDTRGPGSGESAFMPMWGWVGLAIAVVVVFGLIFMWSGDGTQQQAQTPGAPPITGTTPPAKSPTTPPTTPPAIPAPAK